MAAALRQRWAQWWLARHRPAERLLLTQRNVYILPTAAGCMLALTVLVMLIASINFQLNMGYLLTFLLAGSALAGMLAGHANMRGLTLHLHAPQPVFAGQHCLLRVQVHSPRQAPRFGVGLGLEGLADSDGLCTTVVGTATLELAWLPPARGRLALPRLRVFTRFPMGMFRAWALWQPAQTVLVYPAAQPDAPPLPSGPAPQGATQHAATAPGADLEGLRAYRAGDPRKSIVWKKVAQAMARGSADLVSRDSASPQAGGEVLLDLPSTGLHDREQALSRLCAWVLMAHARGLRFGLVLPGLSLAPDAGPAHRDRCLQALALC